MDWDAASKKAMAVLGPKGKIPDPAAAVIRMGQTNGESFDELKKSSKALRTLLTKHQDHFGNYIGAITANQDDINRDNLGLDPKNKEDMKKITQARKLLSDSLGASLKRHEAKLTELKGLDRFVNPIVAYDE